MTIRLVSISMRRLILVLNPIEGQEMGHCVYSYVNRVREGRSIIYGIETEEGRSTLEIREFKVFQHKSKFNQPPPEEHAKIAKEITFNLNEIMKGDT